MEDRRCRDDASRRDRATADASDRLPIAALCPDQKSARELGSILKRLLPHAPYKAFRTPEDCLRYGFCDVLDTYEAESLETVDQKKPAGPAVAQLAEIKLMLQSLSEPAPAPPQEPEYVSTIKDTLTRAMKGE